MSISLKCTEIYILSHYMVFSVN